MDFSKREVPTSVPGSSEANINSNQSRPMMHSAKKRMSGDWANHKTFRAVQALLSLCVLVVIVGLLVFLAFNDSSSSSESSYVKTNKLQAVFLNTGQVYFGTIKTLNTNFLTLTNVFYLQTNSSSSTTSTATSNTSVTLVKLGCEIHAPLDQMIVNKASVTFWENLSPTGEVAKAVGTWEKDNPNGQKCSDQSTAGTSGVSSPQGTTSTTSTTK
jgi:hypothetical protein